MVRHATSPLPLRTLEPALTSLARARDYLAAHCAENVSLHELSALTQLSPFAFLRGFSRAYGLPPHAWLVQERVRRSTVLLRMGRSLTAVASELGFSDQSHFTRHFKRMLGVTPGRYRRAAKRQDLPVALLDRP